MRGEMTLENVTSPEPGRQMANVLSEIAGRPGMGCEFDVLFPRAMATERKRLKKWSL